MGIKIEEAIHFDNGSTLTLIHGTAKPSVLRLSNGDSNTETFLSSDDEAAVRGIFQSKEGT